MKVVKFSTWVVMFSILANGLALGVTVMDEHFDYADTDALRAVWSGSGVLITEDSDIVGTPYMSLGNYITYAELSQPVTTDFQISWKMGATSNLRGEWLWLMNADGSQGYGVCLDTGISGNYSYTRLNKIDDPNAMMTWRPYGTSLASSSTNYVFDSAAGTTFCEFELSWTAATGEFVLTVNGEEEFRVVDTDFNTFNRIYLVGNAWGLFDDIVMTTAAPAEVYAYESEDRIHVGNRQVCVRVDLEGDASGRTLGEFFYYDLDEAEAINFRNASPFYPELQTTGSTESLKYVEDIEYVLEEASAEVRIRLRNAANSIYADFHIKAWRDQPWIDYWFDVENNSFETIKRLDMTVGGFDRDDPSGYVVEPTNGSGQLITFSDHDGRYWPRPITYRIMFTCLKVTAGVMGVWWPDGPTKLANVYLRYVPDGNRIGFCTNESMWVPTGESHQSTVSRLGWYSDGDWMTAARAYREDRLATYQPTPLWQRAEANSVTASLIESPLYMICEGSNYETRANRILSVKQNYGVTCHVKTTCWAKRRHNHGDFDYFPVREWYWDPTNIWEWPEWEDYVGRIGFQADMAFRDIVVRPIADAGMVVGPYTLYTAIGVEQNRVSFDEYVSMDENGTWRVDWRIDGNVAAYKTAPDFVANGDSQRCFYRDIDRLFSDFGFNHLYMDTLGAAPRYIDHNPLHGGPDKSSRSAYEGVITMVDYVYQKGGMITSEGTPEFLILRDRCDGSGHTPFAISAGGSLWAPGHAVPLLELLYHDYWLCCRASYGDQDQHAIRSLMHGGQSYAAGVMDGQEWGSDPESVWGQRIQHRIDLYQFGLACGLQTAQFIDWEMMGYDPAEPESNAEICYFRRADAPGGIVTLGNYREGQTQSFSINVSREKFGISESSSCTLKFSNGDSDVLLPPGQAIEYSCTLGYPEGLIIAVEVSQDVIPGDANGDGVVDVGDLGILAANYGMSEGATVGMGDFNGDEAVDVGDLGILAAHYGEGVSGAVDFEADYAKTFGETAADDAEDESGCLLCSGLGLPLILGVIFALLWATGMRLVTVKLV
jgi:hypothetical protein